MAVWLGMGWTAGAAEANRGPVQGREYRQIPMQEASPESAKLASSDWQRGVAWPEGSRTLGGVTFQIESPCLLASITAAQKGRMFPHSLRIPVPGGGLAFRAMHILHSMEGSDRPGRPLYQVIFHYADGSSSVHPVRYGVHLVAGGEDKRGVGSGDSMDPGSAEVWNAPAPVDDPLSGGARLYRSRIAQDRTGVLVREIELVSMYAQGTVGLLGMSAEVGEGEAVRGSMGDVGREERKRFAAEKWPDTTWKQGMGVTVLDGDSAQALAGARVYFSIQSGEETYLWSERVVNGEGKVRLEYPPTATVGWVILAQAEGHVPEVVRASRWSGTGKSWPQETVLKLTRGREVGGKVTSADGGGVSNAVVTLYRLIRNTSRESTRVDHGRVKTDGEGRWVMRSFPMELPAAVESGLKESNRPTRARGGLPRNATGFFVEIRHPEFRGVTQPVLAGDGGAEATNGVSVAGLLAKSEMVALRNAYRMRGVVSGQDGTLISGAWVEIHSDTLPVQRLGVTDDKGRYEVAIRPESWAGDESASLVISKPGWAPFAVPLGRGTDVEEVVNSEPVNVTLNRPAILVLNVMDQMGKPASDVEVRVQSPNGNGVVAQGKTDRQGMWTWSNGVPGQVQFSLSGASYSRMNYRMDWGTTPLTVNIARQSMAFGTVVDAETGKAIPEFNVVRGRTYSVSEPMRWERRSPTRGRAGAFSVKLEEFSQGKMGVMVEAPGYLPVAGPEIRSSGWVTNVYRMKRGKGPEGRVVVGDGEVASGATVMLLDASETAYVTTGGQLNRNTGQAQMRVGADGAFAFPPRLGADYLVAIHPRGWGEMSLEEFEKTRVLALKPWAKVEGAFRVGDGSSSNETIRLQRSYGRVFAGDRNSDPVQLDYSTTVGADRNFQFDLVVPGEVVAYLHYPTTQRRNGGPIALSHRTPVMAKAGEVTRIVMGGVGRQVRGKIKLVGGDPAQVDWNYDVHRLSLVLPPLMNQPSLSWDSNATAEERQKKEDEYRVASAKFWKTSDALEWQRRQRDFVAVFNTNGSFHIDHVPPGIYSLRIAPTEVREDYYSYRELGQLTVEVKVPEGGGDNQAIDLGELRLKIRGGLKVGRPIPSFEVKTMKGEVLTRESMLGTNVVFYFWASWAAGAVDKKMLQELNETYGTQGTLRIVNVNLDGDSAVASKMAEESGLVGAHVFGGGNWSQEGLAADFGLESFPQAVVMDTNGNVAGAGMRGAGLRNVVRNLHRPKEAKPRTDVTPRSQPLTRE